MKIFQTGEGRYSPAESASAPTDHPNHVRYAQVNQRSMALVVGLAALCLPVLMMIAAWHRGSSSACFRDSISHFYYAPLMGSFFVGILVFIGAYLMVYQGEDENRAEYWLSTFAGLFAFGVALFPTSGDGCEEKAFNARVFLQFQERAVGAELTSEVPALGYFQMYEFLKVGEKSYGTDLIHYTCAALLFAFLAWFAFFVFTSVEDHQKYEDGSLKKSKIRRNFIYKVCGVAMVAAMVAMGLSKLLPPEDSTFPIWWNKYNLTFWCEAVALWAFGLSWMVKGRFLGRWLEDA